MAAYTYSDSNTTNFSSTSTERYSLTVNVTATAVVGGMELAISSYATLFNSTGITPAFSASGTRGYSVPNGRVSSTSGTLTEANSGVTWSYDFGANTQQTVWSGFNRYIASGAASTASVTITANGSGSSFLQSASTPVSGLSLSIPYALNYNANGGSGSVSSTTTSSTSDSVSLTAASGSGLSRSGYNFTGWNTAANGSGTAVSAGGSFTLTGYSNYQQTLYAQWEVANVTITFDYQGGSGSPSSRDITPGSSIGTLPSASLGSYNFVGWYYSPNGAGGQVQSSTTFSSNDTIYAYYESTVVFDDNGGNGGGVTFYVPKGNSVTPSSYNYAAGTRSGYTFTGWSPYNSTFTPTGYTTLTAQWTALTVSWTDNTLTTTGRKGDFYSSTVSASYVSYWNDGALPTGGLSFIQGTNTSGSSTSTVSGTPTTYGNISFTLTPYNQDGVAGSSYSYTIAVKDIALNWSDQLLASSLAVQNQSYTDGVAVDSGPDVTYSVNSGSLPTGLSLNSSTGAITGTPTVAGEFNFVIRATNGSNEVLDTGTLTITVEAAGGYVKVWNGSSWANGTAYVRQSGTWVEGTVKLRGASSWGDSFSS